jgi:hypothetical protein
VNRLDRCRSCGARVVVVPVLRSAPVDDRLRDMLLVPAYDPAASPIPPSHALARDRAVCHPITAGWPLAPGEIPALTHFAICPARSRTKTPTTAGGPR